MSRHLHFIVHPINAAVMVATALALGAFIFMPTSAHAAPLVAPQRAVGYTGTSCYTLRVELRGNLPPVTTCLQALPPARGVQPSIANRFPCNSSDLHLYQDQGESGASICFFNTGTVNLSDWHINPFVLWDNTASSYFTGIWCATFWTGSNQTGTAQGAPSLEVGDCDGVAGDLPNDTLSSVRIRGSNCL